MKCTRVYGCRDVVYVCVCAKLNLLNSHFGSVWVMYLPTYLPNYLPTDFEVSDRGREYYKEVNECVRERQRVSEYEKVYERERECECEKDGGCEWVFVLA